MNAQTNEHWNTHPQQQSREDAQAEEIVDEIAKLRNQLREVMGKVGSMKWGQDPDAN